MNYELELCNKELEVIPDILQALKAFLEITKVLGAETTSTISLIIPYITSLLQDLRHITANIEAGNVIVSSLHLQAKNRLLKYKESTIARHVLYQIFLYFIHGCKDMTVFILIRFMLESDIWFLFSLQTECRWNNKFPF